MGHPHPYGCESPWDVRHVAPGRDRLACCVAPGLYPCFWDGKSGVAASPAAGMRGLEAAQPPQGLAGWHGWHGVLPQMWDISALCERKKRAKTCKRGAWGFPELKGVSGAAFPSSPSLPSCTYCWGGTLGWGMCYTSLGRDGWFAWRFLGFFDSSCCHP